MKKYLMGSLSAAALSLAVVYAAPVYAEHKSCGQCVMKDLEHMKKDLALTPDQEQKLKSIKEKSRVFMESKRGEHHMIRQEEMKLSKMPVVDKKKLEDVANKAGKLKHDMVVHSVMTRHDVYQVLTPEQREKMDKMKHNMRDKMKDGMKDKMKKRMDMMQQQ